MATSNLRSRAANDKDSVTAKASAEETGTSPEPKPSIAAADDDNEGPTRLSFLDIIRVLAGLILLSITLSYFITGNSITWNYRPAFTRPARIKAWLVRFFPPPHGRYF